MLVVPVLVAPVLVDPVLVDPVLVDPVLAVPLTVPPEAVSVGLVVAPPEPGVLDADGGVEDALPGADEDSVALGVAVLDGVAVDVAQGVPVALGEALRPALLLAFAEAVEVASRGRPFGNPDPTARVRTGRPNGSCEAAEPDASVDRRC